MSTTDNPTLQSPLNTASKDKFVLRLDLPFILKKRAESDPKINIEPLLLSVHGSVVPDIQVPEVDLRFLGQNLHVSTYARPNYPPLTVNFTVDNHYNNYYVLWEWLDSMNLAIDNFYGGTPLKQSDIVAIGDQFEYQTTITITALNEYNEPVLDFVYTKAFLSTLGGISYSYREGQSLMECSATFHYSQLNVKKIL